MPTRTKGISYSLLNIYLLPKFVSVYRQALKEVEGIDMTPVHLGNWELDTIEKMNTHKHPDHFYLCAMRSRRIVGIVIIIPTYELDGIRRAFVDTLFVIPEYRKYTHISKMLVDMSKSWAKQRQFKHLLIFEEPNTNKWERKKKISKFTFYKKLLKWDLELDKKEEVVCDA